MPAVDKKGAAVNVGDIVVVRCTVVEVNETALQSTLTCLPSEEGVEKFKHPPFPVQASQVVVKS